MRTLVFGLFVLMVPAVLEACAVDAGSPVSDAERTEIQRGVGSSAGSASDAPPCQTGTAPGRAAPLLESHKQAGADKGPTSEPSPTPWRGDGNGGSGASGNGAQKKDGDLHTKIRDMIEPDDGTHP